MAKDKLESHEETMLAGGASGAGSVRGAAARLRYVTDQQPGLCRVRKGRGFAYRKPDGSWLKDTDELSRINRLAIPPAYKDVWICLWPDGHLQATGRDARGRKQYRYHPEWHAQRDQAKFERMAAFGRVLPRIRRRVASDLAAFERGAGACRAVVLAAVVSLLDTTLVRVGNEEYRRANGSYGLTTLRNRHATVRRSTISLSFKGKSGVLHKVSIDDRRVARVVRRCQGLPGHELFQYEDESGDLHPVKSDDVNAYLREIAGDDYSAKDFRTWHATVHALSLSCESCRPCRDAAPSQPRLAIAAILAEVACRLGNTPAVCRKSYVHPRVLDLGGLLSSDPQEVLRITEGLSAKEEQPRRRPANFTEQEHLLLKFLESSGVALHPRPVQPHGGRHRS